MDLMRRLHHGAMLEEAKRLHAEGVLYAWKLLTLTVPGKGYRETHSPLEALEEMNGNFHKLIRAMKKKLGDFHHFAVCEPQRDGYPHLHVLMVGMAIVPRSILGGIKRLWHDKYGMGFVKLRAKRRKWSTAQNRWVTEWIEDPMDGVRYMTKYMTKGGFVKVGNGKKAYHCSEGALGPAEACKTDYGFPVLTQVRGGAIQEYSGFEGVGRDFVNVFESKSVDEVRDLHRRIADEGLIIRAKVKGDFHRELLCRYPDAELPGPKRPGRRGTE